MKAGKVLIFAVVLALMACSATWAATKGTVSPLDQSIRISSAKQAGNTFLLTSDAIEKAAAKQAADLEGPVVLAVDDGSYDNAIGLTGGGEFLWFNRFTPSYFPFDLIEVHAIFNDGVSVGENFRLFVFEDTDGDGDPGTGSNFLYEENVTCQFNDSATWNIWTLTTPVPLNGPGDVLIGLVNEDGNVVANYPASIDETASVGRSWIGAYVAGEVPSPPVLPTDDLYGVIDSFGLPGNWMCRGLGYFPGPVVDVTNWSFVDECPWGSIAHLDGWADPGETLTFTVTITNNGDLNATATTATLTCPSGNCTIVNGFADIGTLGIGQSVQVTYVVNLNLAARCGDAVELLVTVNANEAPGAWDDTIDFLVGDFTAGPINPTPLFTEDFLNANFLPDGNYPGWDILPQPPSVDYSWYSYINGGIYIVNDPNPAGGAEDCMYVSSDYIVSPVSTQLTSPVIDVTGYDRAVLEFKHLVQDYEGTTQAQVEYSIDGVSFMNLETYMAGSGTATMAAPLTGSSQVWFRFNYETTGWEYYWFVDEVRVYGQDADTCYSTGCLPPFMIWVITPTNNIDVYENACYTFCADMTDYADIAAVHWFVDGVEIFSDPMCLPPTPSPWCIYFNPGIFGLGPHTFWVEAEFVSGDMWPSQPLMLWVQNGVGAMPNPDPPSGVAPLSVHFTANAFGGAGSYVYIWYFGDGTSTPDPPSAAYANPTHIYTDAGDYLVTLVVADGLGNTWISEPEKITVVDLPIPGTDGQHRQTSQDM